MYAFAFFVDGISTDSKMYLHLFDYFLCKFQRLLAQCIENNLKSSSINHELYWRKYICYFISFIALYRLHFYRFVWLDTKEKSKYIELISMEFLWYSFQNTNNNDCKNTFKWLLTTCIICYVISLTYDLVLVVKMKLQKSLLSSQMF